MKLKSYFDYRPYSDILHLTKYELAFCIGYFIFALMVCLYSTPRGSLSFYDSIGYELLAENFMGVFPNYLNGPIYPLLIAIGMTFGLTLEQSAHIIPILCYSLLSLPLFLLSKTICRPMTGYLTCIITLVCGKYLVQISAYSMTDMPYLLITVIAILFLAIYNKYGYMSSITLAAIFTLAAELTRPIGITLFLAGIITIILNLNAFDFKKKLISLADYSLIAGVSFLIWNIFISKQLVNIITTNSSNPSIDEVILKLENTIEQLFFADYKLLSTIILFIGLGIVIYLAINHQLSAFIKDTIALTIYSLIYIIVLTIVTSSFWISFDGGILDIRKIVQIYPYIILLLISLYTYFNIKVKSKNIAFNAIFILLLIGIIIQGSGALYSHATDLRKSSMIEFTNREILNSYIAENNISKSDNIYLSIESAEWPNLARELLWGNPSNRHERNFIATTINGRIIFNKIKIYSNSSNYSLVQLIRKNNGAPIYIIMPSPAARIYITNSSNDIRISNICKISNLFILKASIPDNSKFYISDLLHGTKILESNLSNKNIVVGKIIPADHPNHHQLLISSSKYKHTQKDGDNIRIIDFSNDSLIEYEYSERYGIIQSFNDPAETMLSGDFMDLGYDQILSIIQNHNKNSLLIEDFNQRIAPAIIRYSEALSNTSPLRNLTGPEDAQLAGDFLALGHSQVLFMNRSSNKKRLILADFSKNKSVQIREMPLIGDSARIARWLGKDDLQFVGDFMGLGHSQVLFINCNHTKDEKEKLIILDFSNGESSSSIKYQENWGESGIFSGWIDFNDTQLVGDLMGLGHSQVLFVNHGKKYHKIQIVDFSKCKGKPPALVKFFDKWNGSDLFEGWLSLNDTMISGDFKGLGHDQVLFLNSSSNATNAIIVDFIDHKPIIAF